MEYEKRVIETSTYGRVVVDVRGFPEGYAAYVSSENDAQIPRPDRGTEPLSKSPEEAVDNLWRQLEGRA